MNILPASLATFGSACIAALAAIATGYYFHTQPVWIAWAIGVLVGLTANVVSRNSGGTKLGVIALSVTLLAFLSSQIVLNSLSVKQRREQYELLENAPDSHLWIIATEIAEEKESQGQKLEWPKGASSENALYEEDFPTDIWLAAKQRWDEMTEEEKQHERLFQKAFKSAIKTQFSSAGGESRLVLRDTFAHMPPLTYLFLVLGLFSAYRIGAGWHEDSPPTVNPTET